MSSCSNLADGLSDKFVITKGSDNSFVFTVKKSESTLPITISDSDTFEATLRNLGSQSVVLTKSLTVIDAASGKVQLDITELETAEMGYSRGDAVDRYYPKPQYSMIIECSTDSDGDFIAKVPLVYVD
jgi:hypothetical protein